MALSISEFFYSLMVCITRMCKSFRAVQFGYPIWSASFFNHILSVFLDSAKPKMGWINAFRNIAFVAYKKFVWYFSEKSFPYPPGNNYPFPSFIGSGANPHSPIHVASSTFSLSAFKPNPATTRGLHVAFMEARNISFSFINHAKS